MRASIKPENRYFCGEPSYLSGGMRRIKLINANSETAALFAYLEARSEDTVPPKVGDEIMVVDAGTTRTFTLLSDPDEEATND